MKLNIMNKELSVGSVRMNLISSSSVFLVGDTQVIHCSSIYDDSTASLGSNSDGLQVSITSTDQTEKV